MGGGHGGTIGRGLLIAVLGSRGGEDEGSGTERYEVKGRRDHGNKKVIESGERERDGESVGCKGRCRG